MVANQQAQTTPLQVEGKGWPKAVGGKPKAPGAGDLDCETHTKASGSPTTVKDGSRPKQTRRRGGRPRSATRNPRSQNGGNWVGRRRPSRSVGQSPAGIRSRTSRRRHSRHVTLFAGGSDHPDFAPGSVEHRAMRQNGVTAWNTGMRPLEYVVVAFRRATNSRCKYRKEFSIHGWISANTRFVNPLSLYTVTK
jgi:hypothetical protein